MPIYNPNRQLTLLNKLRLAQQEIMLRRLATQASLLLRLMPDRPGHGHLMSSLDILGKVVQVSDRVHQRRRDPLAPIVPSNAEDLRSLRHDFGSQDPRARAEALDILSMEDPLDVQTMRAVAVLLQRDLLEMDPPDLVGCQFPWQVETKETPG